MATIATAEKFIQAHPNCLFKDVLGVDTHLPTAYTEWFNMIQDIYIAWLKPTTKNPQGLAITLDQTGLAIYSYWTDPSNVSSWLDRVTLAELTKVLSDLKTPNADYTGPSTTPAFPNTEDITGAVNSHYLDITITIDVDGVYKEFNADGNTYISNYVAMVDNHPKTAGATSGPGGEGGSELESWGLQPSMTVTWTALSKQNGHTIQLEKFGSSNISSFELLAPLPVQMPGSANIFITKALSSLPKNANAQYMFYLTIDNKGDTFYFDPFIGDINSKKEVAA